MCVCGGHKMQDQGSLERTGGGQGFPPPTQDFDISLLLRQILLEEGSSQSPCFFDAQIDPLRRMPLWRVLRCLTANLKCYAINPMGMED